MKPCEAGYPCSYLSHDCDHCMLPRCVVKHVTIVGEEGEYAHDELTRRTTAWVTVERKPVVDIDPLDDWYEAWAQSHIDSADTYERIHGRVRQKRHAMRV